MIGHFVMRFDGTRPVLFFEGTEVAMPREMHLWHRVGDYPQVLCLFDAPSVEIEGQGEMELRQVNQGGDASAFLDQVDPAKLEATVAIETDYATSPVLSALGILKRWANAESH